MASDLETAKDDLTAIIARIEFRRVEMEKESDASAARNEALRQLRELLQHERKALQLPGPGTHHPSNIKAIMLAIARVKKPAVAANQGAVSKKSRAGRHQAMLENAAGNFQRNKARNTMGGR